MGEDDDAPLTSPFLPWISLLLTLGGVALACRGLARPQWPPALVGGGLLLYLVAEAGAPRLAGFGRFPLSLPALLVLAAAPGMGPIPWCLALLAGAVLRWALAQQRGEPALSVVADLCPEAWAGVAAAFAPAGSAAWLGALAYLGGWQVLPGIFVHSLDEERLAFWSLARERALALTTFLALLGGCLAGLVGVAPLSVAVMLTAVPLLRIVVEAQLRVLQSEAAQRSQQLRERAQTRASHQLAEMRSQVELQRIEVEMQHRLLTLVGELFIETSQIDSPADLRPGLLGFLRRVIPAARISLWENENGQLRCSGSLGSESLAPGPELLRELGRERVHSQQLSAGGIHHLAAWIPERGLLILSDARPRWGEEHGLLLARLAHHLPLCLDALRFRELQARALEGEQIRVKELDILATRLTATLDLLGQLVSCRSLEELIGTSERRLPELIGPFRVVVEWSGRPSSAVPDGPPSYQFPLVGTRSPEGRLLLYARGGEALQPLDSEMLRLFSSQLACLLDGAELNSQLLQALEQLKQSQGQLVQSSKMAAIGQLAAGVAHELNTPLGAISIAIELAGENLTEHPDRASKRLGKALESVEQMQAIISKLLFYSRDSRGVRAPLDLNRVLADSVGLVSHTLKLDGVQLERIDGPELTMEGNANELQQVFSNLLINAKDSCKQPQAQRKRIEVWLEKQGDQALVHVRDYGAGMDEATRTRIFEPFFTTKPIGEGTGLGLSTSLELVQQHGGTLTVQSQPGQGAHFVVTLPLEGGSRI